jgi:hypothetical protein
VAAPFTGVMTGISKPYLELLTDAAERQAARLNTDPRSVLEKFVLGKGALW